MDSAATPQNDTNDPQDVVPGVVRRSTSSALERLSRVTGRPTTAFSAWYEPGLDYCFYAPAETAFKATEAGLKKLKLSSFERKTLATTRNLEMVIQRMNTVKSMHDAAIGEDSVLMARLARLTNGFCDFATRVSAIVNILLPQSPEYTVTFGLMTIVFEAVVEKKEKQQALAEFVESVTALLPVVEFYETMFPTNAMKTTAAALYVEVITFLEAATRYYCTGRFTKFVDAMFKPIEYHFDDYMSRIKEQTKRMNDLATAAHVAQTNDMKDVVEDTGYVISRIYENLEGAVAALGSSIAMVNQRVEMLHLDQSYITTFHAKSYVQTLRHEVYPEISSAGAELDQLASRAFKLSPKDHWDRNGVLDYFSDWSDTGRRATLWVGGRSGNQETWVTEMSVDLIRALESQEKTAVYVFCKGIHGPLSPSLVARRLIVQLLESYPLLAFHNPELFNARKLSRAKTFVQLWSICQMLVDHAKDVFVIIDRVDMCEPESEAEIAGTLLPSLARLAKSCPQASVVLTADRKPPHSLKADDSLQSVWIDTEISPHERYNKRD